MAIRRAEEERRKVRSLTDDLAEIHAAVNRRNRQDRTVVELRIAQGDRRADVGDRFEAALALLAISRSHTPAK